MKDGLADFTFEYSSIYKVIESGTWNKTSGVTLNGPFNNEIKYNTSIDVTITTPNGPDGPLTNAKDLTNHAEYLASSSMDYKLLNKSEFILEGVTAYRFDYMERDLTPIDRGLGKPPITIYREVRFDSQGLIWFIQMSSDSSTAESDKPDFEHVLETFKILD